MTNEDILNGNKLIAEFMGFINTTPNDPDFNIYENEKGNMQETMSMKYHSSWDSLMPVVDKIESLGYVVTIKGITCMVSDILQDDTIIQWVLGNKERKNELVWTVCVEFIKWHNKTS